MIEKFYTYWVFYLKTSYRNSHYIPIPMESSIYAYTDVKDYEKEFKLTRDMSKFIIKKYKLTRQEIHQLIENEPTKYLKEIEGITKDENFNCVPFHLVVTEEERIHIDRICNSAISVNIFIYAWDNPYIFKDKYIESLEKIGYLSIYNSISEDGTEISTDTPLIEPDLLSCFLKEFRNLIIKRKEDK